MNRQLLITAALLIFILLSGCIANDGKLINQATYASEGKELREFMKSGVEVSAPVNYSLTNSIEIQVESGITYIDYEIYLSDPIVEMKNVIMSFHLDDEMMNYLDTSHVHQSNVLNEDFTLDITPNGESKGAYLSRSFLLAKDNINKDILMVYQDIYIKITYTLNGNRMEEFYRMEAKPTKESIEYLEQFM